MKINMPVAVVWVRRLWWIAGFVNGLGAFFVDSPQKLMGSQSLRSGKQGFVGDLDRMMCPRPVEASPLASLLRAARSSVRSAAALAAVSALAACSGGQHMSATQEAAQYEQRAHRSYTPPGPRSDPWGPYVREASGRFDVPERWIREVMRVESGGRTELNGMPITSGAGAMGLMQVMPATYDELRGRYSLGDDPYDPENSILAGTAYIRELYDLYGSPGFLAAYNGGPGRLDDYLTRNRPLPDETRRYVAMIGPNITDSFPAKRSMAEQYAMNSVPASIPSGPRYSQPAEAVTAVRVSPSAVTPPVEVAYAPPSSSDAAFDPPPGWRPLGMSPKDVATYVPPPGIPPQASTAIAPPPYVPPPITIAVEHSESYPVLAKPPQPPIRVAAADPLPVPPKLPVIASARPEAATLPEPPPYVPASIPVQTAQAAASGYAPFPSTGSHAAQGFRLVAPALAATAPFYRGSTPGQWAIQVGAFGNEGLAHIAAGSAREQVGSVLAGAHPAVARVREPHGTLYRARLVGLSRDAATQACERLRGHGTCIVLSPDAQF